jgi:hypothetical protein
LNFHHNLVATSPQSPPYKGEERRDSLIYCIGISRFLRKPQISQINTDEKINKEARKPRNLFLTGSGIIFLYSWFPNN